MSKLPVAVIFGGQSSEKEISLATGRYIYALLTPAKFAGLPIFMDSSGSLWKIPDKLVVQNTTSDIEKRLLGEAKKIRFEDLPKKAGLVFNALLGKFGEDGAIQGVLELLGIPYTGSGILPCALGMDKHMSRILLEESGFEIPRYVLLKKNDLNAKLKMQNEKLQFKIKNEIGFPCVVKPISEGSSVGVVVAHDGEDFGKALKQAFYFDDEILVEKYIKGREFMCVVLGNDEAEALLPTEVSFTGEIHTYESKYMPGLANYYTPIRCPKNVVEEIRDQAKKIYKLFGLQGFGRVDGFVVNETEIIISEIHTGTIMVPSSYVFQQAARHKTELKTMGSKGKINLSPGNLVAKIIELAMEAHKNKKQML